MSVPFFRLASVTYKAFKKTKINFWDASTIKTKVHPNDLDINVHMNNARYSTMFDLGRFDFLVRTGLIKLIWKEKWRPVIGSTMVSYLKSLKLYEKFIVSTKVVYFDDKWFYLEHLLKKDNDLMARAFVKCLFLQNGKKIPTQNLLEALHCDFIPPLTPPPALISWLKAEEELKQHAPNH
ncbi:MAG: thioesterase family protein [Alphaproteobacteria bacterium]|nr:thioesterase family protein [Alphaproteobacteria bacterium]